MWYVSGEVFEGAFFVARNIPGYGNKYDVSRGIDWEIMETLGMVACNLYLNNSNNFVNYNV